MKTFITYPVFNKPLAMLGASFITASITFTLWHASLLLPA
jgi:hypothetical protein